MLISFSNNTQQAVSSERGEIIGWERWIHAFPTNFSEKMNTNGLVVSIKSCIPMWFMATDVRAENMGASSGVRKPGFMRPSRGRSPTVKDGI